MKRSLINRLTTLSGQPTPPMDSRFSCGTTALNNHKQRLAEAEASTTDGVSPTAQ